MAELSFEWDGEKNAANIRNHGIDFLDAALIFENPRIEAVDDRADYGVGPSASHGAGRTGDPSSRW